MALRVTPVYGSRFDAKGAAHTPSCTLVEYGGVSVLINVGWDESCAPEDFPSLPPHSCLILTDSSLGSMGGLPLYYQQYPTTPIYATFPTVKMGQMTLYDIHASISLDGGTPPYSLEDVDSVISVLHTIKYSQAIMIPWHDRHPLLSITAYRAGHVVGGAFFLLQRLRDETSVVFTSTYHVAKELHLDSATLLKNAASPDVMITHPGGPAMTYLSKLYGDVHSKPKLPTPIVSEVEKTLCEQVLSVLRRDGNVLLPVDASGRVLELLLVLNQHWEKQRLKGAYNLCWVAPMSKNTIDYARSQLEWMAAPLGAQFDSQRGHPYQLPHIHICSSIMELENVILHNNNNPSCVLASGLSMDHGPARDLLLKWADNPDHAVIMTDSSQCTLRSSSNLKLHLETSTLDVAAAVAATQEEEDASTLQIGSALPPDKAVSEYTTAAQLVSHWCRSKLEGVEMEDVIQVNVLVPHRAALAGNELKAFILKEEETRLAQKREDEQRAMLQQVELAKGQLRLGEDETTGTSGEGAKTKTLTPSFPRPKKKSRFDSSLFLKFSKPLHLTFEVREEAVGIGQSDSTAKYGIGESVGRSGEVLEDDYGIAVIPERFVDIVTGVDPSKFAGGSGRIGEEVLRRGLGGFTADGRPAVTSSTGGPSVVSVGQLGGAGDNEDSMEEEMDEPALEALDLSEGTGIVRGRNGRPPMKVSTVPRLLDVLAEIVYIPLEGRVNTRAARQSVRALQPGQVVILGGPAPADGSDPTDLGVDEVTLLANSVKSYISGDRRQVLTPSDGETAELRVGHAAYSVRLIDTPYLSQEEVAARQDDHEPPVPVEPLEAQLGECTVSLFDCLATGKKVALDGSIVLASRQFSKPTQGQPPRHVFVSNGEVLLTDLRAELIAEGMKADYSAHFGYAQLLVNGKVVVKKSLDSGKIDIEGPLCQDFYKVRSIVCGQFVSL